MRTGLKLVLEPLIDLWHVLGSAPHICGYYQSLRGDNHRNCLKSKFKVGNWPHLKWVEDISGIIFFLLFSWGLYLLTRSHVFLVQFLVFKKKTFYDFIVFGINVDFTSDIWPSTVQRTWTHIHTAVLYDSIPKYDLRDIPRFLHRGVCALKGYINVCLVACWICQVLAVSLTDAGKYCLFFLLFCGCVKQHTSKCPLTAGGRILMNQLLLKEQTAQNHRSTGSTSALDLTLVRVGNSNAAFCSICLPGRQIFKLKDVSAQVWIRVLLLVLIPVQL